MCLLNYYSARKKHDQTQTNRRIHADRRKQRVWRQIPGMNERLIQSLGISLLISWPAHISRQHVIAVQVCKQALDCKWSSVLSCAQTTKRFWPSAKCPCLFCQTAVILWCIYCLAISSYQTITRNRILMHCWADPTLCAVLSPAFPWRKTDFRIIWNDLFAE